MNNSCFPTSCFCEWYPAMTRWFNVVEVDCTKRSRFVPDLCQFIPPPNSLQPNSPEPSTSISTVGHQRDLTIRV
ncbi:hypothetical protein L1887_11121 [Cichorium endivia]|nr:hypothetical protein L1887_11121 [Cichorium endivia]